MSVPDQETTYFYTGNGVTTTFAYGFYLLSLADIKVSVNGVLQTTGYSVTGVGSQSGGTVVFNTAPINGVSLLIERSVAVKRDTDYQPNGDLRSDVLNTDFDRLWMVHQDRRRENVRSLRYANAENLDGVLPGPASRANMLLGFSATGIHAMIPLPASVGAGDMIVNTFADGIDFTAGVTTQLTLTRPPGAPGNLEIFFDGLYQGPDQWAVSGSVVTFSSAIPAGVSKVFARLGTTLSQVVPPTGVVSITNFYNELIPPADFKSAIDAGTAALAAAGGGSLYFPNILSGYVTSDFIVPAGVHLVGRASIIGKSTASNVITLNSASNIYGLAITRQGTPTSGNHVKILGNKCGLTSCQLTNYFVGITIGDDTHLPVFATVMDCNFFSPATGVGSGAIFLRNYSNAVISGNVAAGAAFPATQPDFGIRVQNGDTGFITDCNITNHGLALYMDVPAAKNNFALRINGSLFDSAGTTASATIVASALVAPLGNVYDMLVTNTWFGLSKNGSGLSVTPGGGGLVDGLCLNNCQFVDNGISGVEFVGAGQVKNFQVNGGYASSNGVYGMRVGAGVSDFQLNGFKAQNVANRGANARGLSIDTGASDRYMVVNCMGTDSTIFNFFDGGTGVNKVVANNLFP